MYGVQHLLNVEHGILLIFSVAGVGCRSMNEGGCFSFVCEHAHWPTHKHSIIVIMLWYLRYILNGKCVCGVAGECERAKPCLCLRECVWRHTPSHLFIIIHTVSFPVFHFLASLFSCALSLARSFISCWTPFFPFTTRSLQHHTHMRARNASHIYCVDNHLWIV